VLGAAALAAEEATFPSGTRQTAATTP